MQYTEGYTALGTTEMWEKGSDSHTGTLQCPIHAAGSNLTEPVTEKGLLGQKEIAWTSQLSFRISCELARHKLCSGFVLPDALPTRQKLSEAHTLKPYLS